MADVKMFRVKAGAVLPHAGEELPAGVEVELPPHVAYEVRHLVDERQADGGYAPIGAADAKARELAQQLATAKPHERISFLKAAHDGAVATASALGQQVAAEEKRLADEARAAGRATKAAKESPTSEGEKK